MKTDLQRNWSALRAHHCTEMALVKATSNLLMPFDIGLISMFVLLDLSAVFDTADHI